MSHELIEASYIGDDRFRLRIKHAISDRTAELSAPDATDLVVKLVNWLQESGDASAELATAAGEWAVAPLFDRVFRLIETTVELPGTGRVTFDGPRAAGTVSALAGAMGDRWRTRADGAALRVEELGWEAN